MRSCAIVILFALIGIQLINCRHLSNDIESDEYDKDTYHKKVQFLNSVPSQDDEKRCTYIPIDTEETQYITGFIPKTTKEVAHHMVLSGCKYLPRMNIQENGNSWNCGKEGICGYPDDAPENYDEDDDDQLIKIFSWALGAKGFKYPEDIGFRVGGDTDIRYLILQIHYAHHLEEPDNSALILEMTSRKLPNQVGVYTIGSDGYVPPQITDFHMETACKFDLPYSIHPLQYRTHSHHLGDVTSGYVIKDGRDWYQLGRMSPKQPQRFYPVSDPDIIINPGDLIASRCTMSSLTRSTKTWMGPTNRDEMCVFYLMFYTSYEGRIPSIDCFKNANKYSWSIDPRIKTAPPVDASSLEGVKLTNPEMENDKDPHSNV